LEALFSLVKDINFKLGLQIYRKEEGEAGRRITNNKINKK